MLKTIALTTIALVGVIALADDEIDSRTKAVDESYAHEIKQPDTTLAGAKEVAARAYQKYCKDKVTALEHATANCEKKLKSAQDAGNKKSVEALTARLAELKDDLAIWKANAAKKWDIQFAEKDSDEKTESKATPRWFVGKWQWFGEPADFRKNGHYYSISGVERGAYEVVENKIFFPPGQRKQFIEVVGEKVVNHGASGAVEDGKKMQ